MKNKKVVGAILLMTKAELEGLNHFIRNPIVNKNQDVVKLFDFIYSFESNYNNKEFTSEQSFKAVYPKLSFNKNKLARILFDLFEIVKEYINFLQNKQMKHSKEFAMLNFYLKRIPIDEKDDRFKNQKKRIQDLINKDFKGIEKLKKNLELRDANANYLSILNPDKDRNTDLFEAMRNNHYATILNVCCDTLNNNLINTLPNLPPQITEFVESIPTDIKTHEIIELWYKTAEAFLTFLKLNQDNKSSEPIKEIDPEIYFDLKKVFQQIRPLLNNREQFNFFVFLNTILNRSDIVEHKLINEQFNNHKQALENGNLFVDNVIRGQDFKNIIILALRCNEIEWLENYLKTTNGKKIEKKYRKMLYFFGLARIEFAREEFQKAESFITQAKIKDIKSFMYFQISVYILNIQICYELLNKMDGKAKVSIKQLNEAVNNLEKSIKRFGTFLLRKEKNIKKNDLKSNKNFIRVINSILKLKERDWESVKKLIAEVKKFPANGIPEREWLLKILNELLKKRNKKVVPKKI